MPKIKFCGLTRDEDIDAVNKLRPDYIGFVFAPHSKRYVNASTAALLKRRLAPNITAVGVFVNADTDEIVSLIEQNIIDAVQLHGNEGRAYIEELRRLLPRPVPIIEAVRIRSSADIQRAAASVADFVLLDGGNGAGVTFDWSLIAGLNRPYFLAGGLTPANVAAAVATLHPYALDVSSGIETDGKKDPQKMAAFVKNVGR